MCQIQQQQHARAAAGRRDELVGHKWFFGTMSMPSWCWRRHRALEAGSRVPLRWRPDGTRNALQVMRLKDKLGNWANASSEVEFAGAWARRIGDEGRGVATILEMVALTRLDCMLGSAAEMRRALLPPKPSTMRATATPSQAPGRARPDAHVLADLGGFTGRSSRHCDSLPGVCGGRSATRCARGGVSACALPRPSASTGSKARAGSS